MCHLGNKNMPHENFRHSHMSRNEAFFMENRHYCTIATTANDTIIIGQ